MDSESTRRFAERFARLGAAQRQSVYRKMQDEGLSPAHFPITVRPGEAGSPASFAQGRQWFLWHLDRDSTAYHITGALRLSGVLDLGVLQRAFGALVARHAALRTVFRSQAGVIEQVVLPSMPVEVVVCEGDPASQAKSLVQTPFDLTAGPLLRVAVIRV